MDDPLDWYRRNEEMIRRLTGGPMRDYARLFDQQGSMAKAIEELDRIAKVPALAPGILEMTSETLRSITAGGAAEEMMRAFQAREEEVEKLGKSLIVGPVTLTANNFNQMIATSELASATIGGVDWEKLGAALTISEQALKQFQLLTNEFAFSHAALIENVRLLDGGFTALPEFVTRVPTENLFVHARTVRLVSPHEAYEDHEEREAQETEGEIDEDTSNVIGTLLGTLHPEYPKMLRGADEAWQNKHSDWPRHSAASLRQVFLDVFHTIAPTNEVKKFVTDPKTQLDSRGNPTRGVKVQWLCRVVGLPEYRRVVEADLVSAIECIDLMHEGVHEPSAPDFEQSFVSVRRRVLVAIRHLLMIWSFRSS